jgi:hypothetical protein
MVLGMAIRTKLRTAALAALVLLGLLATGLVLPTLPMRSEALAPAAGDEIVATVSQPLPPQPTQTTPPPRAIKAFAEKVHPNAATLTSGLSVLTAALILLLLLPPGQRDLDAVRHRSNASRAPPMAS